MIERDKEYYNQKISDLYAVIENQEKIIRDLQGKINRYEDPEDLTLMYMYCDYQLKDAIKELSQRIEKAIEYIKNNTMYFDSEYAKDYGELCPIAGAGDTRIHCVIGDEQLLEILKGEK